jgi:hypothetical protein
MTVTPDPGHIDLLGMARLAPAEVTPRGTWVAVGAAVALLLGRALLWLLVQLLKFLVLLAIVGAILAIGFEVGNHWDTVTGAATPGAAEAPGPAHHG